MKKLLLGPVTLLVLGGAPALAADMPLKARPAPVAIQSVSNWTGFYIGLNAGYGWGDASSTNAAVDPASQGLFGFVGPTDFNTEFRQSGAIVGGQAGYNWQFSDHVVAGIETDLQFSDVRGRGSHSTIFAPGVLDLPFNAVAERRLEWFGTVRGRLGFLATPNLLLYGTGGLTYGEARSRGDVNFASLAQPIGLVFGAPPLTFQCVSSTTCYSGSDHQTSVGWSAGVGGELRLGGNWTAKLEYLHVDLPSTSVRLVSPPPSTPGVSTVYRFNQQAYDFVRIGFNYAWSGPVVAKY
jgi:outer membrane immunogenic protein